MGGCCHLFDRKGVIYVHAVPMNQRENIEYKKLEFEKAFELAIEAGAEDVVEGVDESNDQMFKVFLLTSLMWHAIITLKIYQLLMIPMFQVRYTM